jgi:hypothetical protein
MVRLFAPTRFYLIQIVIFGSRFYRISSFITIQVLKYLVSIWDEYAMLRCISHDHCFQIIEIFGRISPDLV